LDPDTVTQINDEQFFITTNEGKNELKKLGKENVVSLSIEECIVVGDFEITAVFADHTVEAFGLIVKAENKTLYFSGDTLYNYDVIDDVLDLVEDGVDYAFLPINGRGNNMNAKDAADFAYEIDAKCAIPIHYGLVDDVDPEAFDFEDRIILKPFEEYSL
jgi:L-ascorbate metabolism protein UlaG (beta-lactamase superfamily)